MKTLFCGWLLKHDPHVLNFLNETYYKCDGHGND